MNKTLQKHAKPSTILLITLTGLTILAASLFVWYQRIYTDPERVFWGSIENNLSTSSVTRVTNANQNGQTIRQTQDIDFIGELSVQNKVLIEGGGQKVEVETRGFKDVDYIQYSAIELPDTAAQELAADAIGRWAKTERSDVNPDDPDTLFTPQPELVDEALLSSFLLFGNLPADKRGPLVDQLRQAYDVGFESVVEVDIDGNTAYEYNVTIDVSKYAEALATYLRIYDKSDLADTVVSQIEPGTSVSTVITIDKKSRNLVKTSTTGSVGEETYTAHGVSRQLEKLDTDLTNEELQVLLRE